MPKLSYENNLPPPDEFQKALAQAVSETNPVDDLLELADELRAFEQKHNMSSVDFYEKYQAGQLDDALQHCLEWAATYDLFIKIKRQLETALMRAAVQPEFAQPAS